MKWIVLIIIGAAVAFWFYRGGSKHSIENPDVKVVEKKDYYLAPDDTSSDDESSSGDNNPRH